MATSFAGGWPGAVMSWAGAVLIWAGAVTSMKYSYLNFSTFKQLKSAKKVKCDRPTNEPTRLIGHVVRDKKRVKKVPTHDSAFAPLDVSKNRSRF